MLCDASCSRVPGWSLMADIPVSAIVASGPGSSPREEVPDEAGDHIAAHEVRINDRIRAREVLLVGADGEQLGVKPLPEALARCP